jgi:hypothetical protein
MSNIAQFLPAKRRGTAAGSTDLGTPFLGVRKDTGADLAGADGDYAPAQFDPGGNLRVVDEAVKGFVDGLETLLGTLITAVNTVDGHVDGVETLIGTTNTLITALNGYVDGLESLLGAATPAGTNNIGKVSPADDQDPIFDMANGTKTSVTTSATVITPPTGCKYVRIGADVDIFVNTAGATAVDDGTSIRIIAGQPEIVPVTAGTAVKALSSSGTAIVRCMPLKAR